MLTHFYAQPEHNLLLKFSLGNVYTHWLTHLCKKTSSHMLQKQFSLYVCVSWSVYALVYL